MQQMVAKSGTEVGERYIDPPADGRPLAPSRRDLESQIRGEHPGAAPPVRDEKGGTDRDHSVTPKRWIMAALAAMLSFLPVSPFVAVGSSQQVHAADPVETVTARYRARIPELMADQDIPGLAVALVDVDQALWVEGFGHLDGPDSAAVGVDTIFGVQSMSKLFTATAVMQAVSDGRLDLDEPITTYLPEFTVHSVFEEHPERKITLRMLLSHTAGLTHEAPVGNNNEPDSGGFEAHVRSISDTWLRFPVGSGYAYSNLGIDLAGRILERVGGESFPDVMRDSLLGPLGMGRSTFDRAAIRSAPDRAIGHLEPYPAPPVDVPMTAAGGLYTSAADLTRFLRFQLNDGAIDDRDVLDSESMEEMRTVPAPHPDAPAGYALGLVRHRWNRWAQAPDLLEHGGGGFGFLSDLWWSPPLGIGIAILTNSEDHQLQGDLALSILADLVSEPGVYHDRLLALPDRTKAADPGPRFQPPVDLRDLVADSAMAPTGDEAERWPGWVGAYGAPYWEVISPITPAARFLVDGGVPYFEAVEEEGTLTRYRLVEVEPDVFLAENGETLDLSGPTPSWRSLSLVRLTGGPSPWQWAVLATVSALAVVWLVTALGRVVKRARSETGVASESTRSVRWRRIAATMATATALLTLATVGLIVWMPGLVDSGFIGWLDLPMTERLALDMPLALAVLGGISLLLVTVGWARRWLPGAARWQYGALSVAALALVAQLAAWQLTGWSAA